MIKNIYEINKKVIFYKNIFLQIQNLKFYFLDSAFVYTYIFNPYLKLTALYSPAPQILRPPTTQQP